VAIHESPGAPIKLIGSGERPGDPRPCRPDVFVRHLRR